MFDFEKLDTYKKARKLNREIQKLLLSPIKIRSSLKDQLGRASNSILLNIAEGSGRFTYKEKTRYFFISRGSCYECVSILDILVDMELISNSQHQYFYNQLEEISRMLTGLIKRLKLQQ